jgi:hypothetical protein
MRTVELGGIRVHALVAHPGVPGEADRAAREVSLADPALVLADLDTESALRAVEAIGGARRPFEPAFVDALFARESARRFAGKAAGHAAFASREEHPFVAVARVARNRNASFVALRPTPRPPGIFARMRAARAAEGATGGSPEAFARGFADALDEGRAPVVAVLQAHRADAILQALRDTPPRRTVA